MPDNPQRDFLRASIKIGNAKGPTNYQHSQTVFHHDDIPPDKRNRKHDVLEWKKSKILSIDKHNWNQSNQTDIPFCERRTMENHVHDRSNRYNYNYRSESVDYLRNKEAIDKPTKFHISQQLESTATNLIATTRSNLNNNLLDTGYLKRTEPMPINPNLEGSKEWNASTTTVSRRQFQHKLEQMTQLAKETTAKKNLVFGTVFPYESPMESSIKYQEKVRLQKAEGRFDRTLHIDRPATVPVDRTQLRNRYLVGKPGSGSGSGKYSTHEHSGVYEYNAAERRDMWSDTGSYEPESKGDVITYHNTYSYNFEGPNMSRPNYVKTVEYFQPKPKPNAQSNSKTM